MRPTSADPVTVVIADDHLPTRIRIRELLEDAGMRVIADCPDGTTAAARAIELEPDLCLIDLHMPRGDGVQATRAISRALPDVSIVILTVSRNDDDLLAALRAGATGYLLKDVQPERLVHELRSVLRGQASLPRELMRSLISSRDHERRLRSTDGRPVDLSSREQMVLQLLADGLSTGQIADRLVVAPVTVRSHVARVLRKLRASDRHEAVDLWHRAGRGGR